MKIYLDNAATTPLTEEVKNYIISILDVYGNPSSLHEEGYKAKNIIDKARHNVASFINCKDSEITFTSSGSAANSLAILGLKDCIYHTFYSPIAHKSMKMCCKDYLHRTELKVNEFGEIDLDYLEKSIKETFKIPVVCIDAANSEIGTIQDIVAISEITHKYNGIFICDFTGYIPYYKVNVKYFNCDIATFSGHKLHAPKGVGVMYCRKGIDINPIIHGSQEGGLFGGTENVIGIGALGKAIETYEYSNSIGFSRDYILAKLLEIENSYLVGSKYRLPNNIYVCFQGVDGGSLQTLLDMDAIQVSTGSACNSGELNPSKTLLAIGMPHDDVHSCIRITLSGNETLEEMDYLCLKVRNIVNQLRLIR